MATKKARVMIYLPPELKAELDSWAEQENRSGSNLVETVLKDTIANRNQSNQQKSAWLINQPD